VRRVEFLVGKQLPYVALSWISFWSLVVLARLVFGVPLSGDLPLLGAAALLYVLATTGFGQLVSSFTETQVSAVFATAVISIIPAVNFSGLIVPVSTLTASGRAIGLAFPGAWFQPLSVGTFLKGFGLGDDLGRMAMLALFGLIYLGCAIAFLRKQER